MELPNGFVAVVKRDCPTCLLVEPVLQSIEQAGRPLTVYTQDDPNFPAVSQCIDDTSLEQSFRLAIETVPTLIRVNDGIEEERIIGWEKNEWAQFTGIESIGAGLPPYRPGCGSKSVEPNIAEALAIRFGDFNTTARSLEVSPLEDDVEYCFERGWSDGLPVVPPTPPIPAPMPPPRPPVREFRSNAVPRDPNPASAITPAKHAQNVSNKDNI